MNLLRRTAQPNLDLLVDLRFRFAFSLLGITVATATAHDICNGKNVTKSFAIQLLHCFSAKRNCATLFSAEESKDSLSCVHGIRVLSICWIVLIHVGGAFTVLRLVYNRQMVIEVITVTNIEKVNS